MSDPDSAFDVNALCEQYEIMKGAEHSRHEFVEGLIRHIGKLSNEREENVRKLRANEALLDTWQDRCEGSMREVNLLQRAVDCGLFVLVLIDGDITLFKDEYINNGIDGGQQAARDLQQALFEHFKSKHYFKHDHKILTKIYLNLTGFLKIYNEARIASEPVSLQRFVQGFNKTHDLMTIIDAGDGKAGADSKIKAEFGLFRRNQHCKQIVLAGSGDDSYAALLRQYAPSVGRSDAITLIETVPFAREIRLLSDKFENICFGNIFRNTKIPNKLDLSPGDPRNVTAPLLTSVPAVSFLPGSPPATYAAKALHANAIPTTINSTNGTHAATEKVPRSIFQNEFGQRVDRPIKNLNNELVFKLKNQKLCNQYHLEKHCTFGDFCDHTHGPTLSIVEVENLRSVARLRPCEAGLDCRDPDCLNGHRCQHGARCKFWEKGACRFSDEMHRVEMINPRAVPVRL